MRTKIALLFTLLVPAWPASLPSAKPEDVGLVADRLGRIQTTIQRYIDRHEIAGAVTLVARRGRVAWLRSQGVMSLESQQAMRDDSMFAIASMTKPITSVAAMMLYEEGYFQLNDPVSKFIPEFKNMNVAMPSAPAAYKLVPADQPITIRHLLTHTAGLPNTYVGLTKTEYDKITAARKPEDTVGDFTKQLAKLPLNFQPGTSWEYGPATDVLGYLVEVISGKPLDQYFEETIFKPLGMKDTSFYPPDEKAARRATIYTPVAGGGIRPMAMPAARGRKFFSGAGGLSSTAPDYVRFCQMLLNGGQLDGTRLLSRKTVELMTQNHIGPTIKLWDSLPGERFGLGFSVRTDLGESANLGSAGMFGWGGAFGTIFWIDPKEQMIGILMIQLRPYDQVNIRQDIRTMAYQAIAE
ncbi:MAG TPA: serine hydrolase domain-containing protein [Candidatus Acidoferrales bacterium]|nr:serine hydrolase domain-containing protein [Candidatus Acidoferrales bacterium]